MKKCAQQIEQRIVFQLVVMMYKTVKGMVPNYLQNCVISPASSIDRRVVFDHLTPVSCMCQEVGQFQVAVRALQACSRACTSFCAWYRGRVQFCLNTRVRCVFVVNVFTVHGVPGILLNRLQSVLNAEARVRLIMYNDMAARQCVATSRSIYNEYRRDCIPAGPTCTPFVVSMK